MYEGLFRKFGFAVVGVAALSLAACGGSGGGSGEDTGSSGSSSGETRSVEHAMGTADVPAEPERVVVLDTGELDSAITLGVTPVGAVEAVEGMGLPEYLDGETSDVEIVGTIEEPNLETISTLEPDLILSSSLRHEGIYDQLSQIAPTVFTEETGVTWQENFDKHAEALNREDEAEQVVSAYESRIEELQNSIGDEPPTVSVVRFIAGDTRVYQRANFIGTILQDAELPRPAAQDVDEFALLNVSAEAIPDMDADVIYTTVYGEPSETAQSDITSDQLWQNLDAVQNDRVFEVSDDLWMLGIGYTAADGILSDLQNTATNNDSTMMQTTMMETTN